MGKSSKKVLASAAALCLVLSSTPVLAAETTTAPERLAGQGRVQTAIKVAEQSWKGNWKASKTAVLAGYVNEVDALAVAPLAYKLNAPILLNDAKDSINAETLKALKDQGVTKVYIATGSGVISDKAVEALKAEKIEVVRLGGADRYATAKNIYDEFKKQGGNADTVALVAGTGLADALSVAPIAAKAGMPILMTSGKDTVAASLKEVAAAAKKVYAVGGNGVISDALVNEIKAERFGGDSRYATNAEVIKGFASKVKFDKVYLANGASNHLVDALTGSVLAAQTESPIVLADKALDASVKETLKGKVTDKTSVVALGGEGSVSADLVKAVKEVNKVEGELKVESVSAIGVRKIKVVFGSAVDTAKAKFSLKKGNIAFNISEVKFSEDKTSAELILPSNLTKGEYTVSVSGLTEKALTGNVTVEDQKASKIEIAADSAASVKDPTTGDITSATISYKVINQYGEDITKTADPINWTVAMGTITPDSAKGVLTLAGKYMLNQDIAIIGVMSNGTVINKTVKIGLPSSVSSVAFVGPYNEYKKELNTNTVGDFYLLLDAKDQYGNKITKDQLKKDMLITSSNPTIANIAGTIESPEVSDALGENADKLGIKLAAATGSLKMEGTTTIKLISKTSGTTFTYDLSVKKAATVTTFTMSQPEKAITCGETVEIPFSAQDQYGKEVTSFSALKDTVKFPGQGDGTVEFVNDYVNKKAILKYTASTMEGPHIIMAMVNNKPVQLTIDVKKAAVAQSVSKVADFTSVLAKDGTSKLNVDNLVVIDNYGREMDLDDTFFAKYEILVSVASGDKVALSGKQIASTSDEVTFTGKEAGRERIKLSLATKADNKEVAGSEYEFYATTVKDDTLTKFEADDVKTISKLDAAHAVDFNVYGVQEDGTKVALPTGKYTVTTTVAGLNFAAGKLDATGVSDDAFAANSNELKGAVIVVVNGANGTVTLNKEITVSKAALRVETLAIKDATRYINGVLKVTAADAVDTSKLTSAIKAKDQFGVAITPSFASITFTNLVDADKAQTKLLQVNEKQGKEDAAILNAEAGDEFTMTVVTSNGKSISLKVVVGE
ncbi:cell wall-binding repeat-containing protein [Haloimpatiens sp. FM7315]|uniref:cell wall-binding repeat-containing protein n=1 Tax=Haloimpatiens sp. FM7315 TaxID=3298609 RepID=UPI0035A3C327